MTALLLQISRSRDAADDAALIAAARELSPVAVIAATTRPERTARVTHLPTIAATLTSLLRALPRIRTVVVLGGQPLASAARDSHLMGLPELACLAMYLKTSGRWMALVGVGAGVLSTRNDAYLARQVVLGSALTVLDGKSSVARLTAAGIPAPLRVGADLAWLELQQPPISVRPREDVLVTLTKGHADATGGANAVAEQLSRVITAAADRLGCQAAVTVQAWHTGTAAGDDLDSAAEIAAILASSGLPATVAPPPVTLSQQRDLASAAALNIVTSSSALMAARATRAPVLAWPSDAATHAMAERLGVPKVSQDSAADMDAARSTAGAALPRARQQIAIAREVADLLKVVLTQGNELPRLFDAAPLEPSARLRPIGVLR